MTRSIDHFWRIDGLKLDRFVIEIFSRQKRMFRNTDSWLWFFHDKKGCFETLTKWYASTYTSPIPPSRCRPSCFFAPFHKMHADSRILFIYSIRVSPFNLSFLTNFDGQIKLDWFVIVIFHDNYNIYYPITRVSPFNWSFLTLWANYVSPICDCDFDIVGKLCFTDLWLWFFHDKDWSFWMHLWWSFFHDSNWCHETLKDAYFSRFVGLCLWRIDGHWVWMHLWWWFFHDSKWCHETWKDAYFSRFGLRFPSFFTPFHWVRASSLIKYL